MTDIGIIGTGSYLPDRVVTNAEISPAAGVDAAWIERKTGIRERRHAAPGQATSNLAAIAADRALLAAGLSPDDVDHVVVATSTPDCPQPATASLVQHLIGARSASAVDVNAVCSGFVYALAMAQGLVRDGGHALVIGADIYSRILDVRDRKTAILFGDGAGAVVLGPVPAGGGVIGTRLRGHGDAHRLIGVRAGGSRVPASVRSVLDGEHFFRMDGRGVREFVAGHVPDAIARTLGESGLPAAAVDHFVPHQANGVLLRELGETLDLPNATLHLTVDRYANTGAASVPITLDAAHRAGALNVGDVVLLAGFGGGMNLGVGLCRWTAVPPRPEAGAEDRAVTLSHH
ncbi:ketoacyl-ACP synthase III [Amycolatopsis sp. SID8362]|uniref:3-oxoacyl-ACP synthase III family protein n=1 Tax=Amycolatopsis sp. SID8362 TaxID=2690346 RepID=UPI001367EC6A|nr:ketoacyl-ACP synthase III [Amycolatopsis sp. SID8362]NBH05123.1 beta-ketoacyl-ACP synthase 3 [Amycolatopsis sp. SID8362]NED41823.1 ketoacyl-ACP synthase III [Amycolatopsis sp. SID8362]